MSHTSFWCTARATRSRTSTPGRRLGSRATSPTPPTCSPSATNASQSCRKCSTPTARAQATTSRCFWCCRAWTPRARAGSSNTLSERPTRRAFDTTHSVCRARKSASTTTCGGSGGRCLRRATSACSTGHITRTCWWCGFTIWCRPRCGASATTRSTRSRSKSSNPAPPSSRWRCSSRWKSRRSG